jgi:hypothetical protein
MKNAKKTERDAASYHGTLRFSTAEPRWVCRKLQLLKRWRRYSELVVLPRIDDVNLTRSKRLAADRPDPLAPVHALALQHAQALQIGEIFADAHVRAGSVRASA